MENTKPRALIDIVNEIGTTPKQRERLCTNRGRDKYEPYCLATSCTDCKGCRFFQANLNGQAEVVFEYCEKLKAENKALSESFAAFRQAAEVVSMAVQTLHIFAAPTEKEKAGKEPRKDLIPIIEEIIAESNRIVNAGGNAKFVCEDGRGKA